jgi:hypothetical protein
MTNGYTIAGLMTRLNYTSREALRQWLARHPDFPKPLRRGWWDYKAVEIYLAKISNINLESPQEDYESRYLGRLKRGEGASEIPAR